MEADGRIDKIVQLPVFADGRRFKEFVALKSRSFAVHNAGSHKTGFLRNGQHIRPKHGAHGAVAGSVPAAAETGIEIRSVSLRQDAGIELRFIPGAFAQAGSLPVLNITVKGEGTCGRIADGYGNKAFGAEHIVQIIPAVRPPGNIRRIQVSLQILIFRILILAVNHAFAAPVPQVVHRGGPAHIVPHTVDVPAEKVMRPVNINPVAVHMRLSVGNIFPERKVGIDDPFLLHDGTLLSFLIA